MSAKSNGSEEEVAGMKKMREKSADGDHQLANTPIPKRVRIKKGQVQGDGPTS
jgi:hypothetical protein